MPTSTTVYQLTKPDVGGSTNVWGGLLNTDEDTTDALLARPNPQFFVSSVGALNLNNGNHQEITVAAPITISLVNIPPALASGLGSATLVWLKLINGGANVTWPTVTWLTNYGQAPTLKSAGTDLILLFTTNQGTTLYGVHMGIADPTPVISPTVTATTTCDLSLGSLFAFTLSQNTTVLFTNPGGTRSFKVLVTNGGSQSSPITWPGSVVWLGGKAPSLKAAGVDLIEFTSPDGGTTWYGSWQYPQITAMRCQIHPTVNQGLSGNSPIQVVWGTTDYNVGTLGQFTLDSAGIIVPAGMTASGVLLLTVQLGLSATNDPSPDPNARMRVVIKTLAGVVVAENWYQMDSQNNNPDGHRMQCSVVVNNPVVADKYVVTIQMAPGAGTPNLLAANSWFAAVMLP